MSTPNINYSNLDGRYSKPTDVSAAVAAQATADAGKYTRQSVPGQNIILDSPSAQSLYWDNFPNTSIAGAVPTPPTGSSYILSGPGLASVQVSPAGQLISPAAVTYVEQLLAVTPGRLRQRFILTANGGSATMACVAGQANLNLTNVNMVHVSVTQNFISLTVWTNGTSNLPANNGQPNAGAVSLSLNVEYEMNIYMEGSIVSADVIRTSDGALMGAYNGSDSNIPSCVGPLIYVEPGTGGNVTLAAAYLPATVRHNGSILAPDGVQGPIGLMNPQLGIFAKAGIGTNIPTSPIHVVQGASDATPGQYIQSAHAVGASLRIESTSTSTATTLLLANSHTGSSPTKLYIPANSGDVWINIAGTDVYKFGATGAATITPPTGNSAILALVGNGTGYNAVLKLQASGGTAAQIYQQYGSNDLRIQTSSTDRLIVDSAGGIALKSVATTTVAPAAGAAGALPATPAGYFSVTIGSTLQKVPYY